MPSGQGFMKGELVFHVQHGRVARSVSARASSSDMGEGRGVADAKM
jgi:hypothetical protein